ncbi:MAG: hypothetical protein KDK34_06395 [Leptospiraceae bacterium]|nr:hypothetical protein [Leptospiraceae bacterium]
MAAMETLENGARDLLNAGLGAYRTVEARINEIQKQVEQNFSSLVNSGAADNSETTVQLRRYLDQGIAAVKNVQDRVNSALPRSA